MWEIACVAIYFELRCDRCLAMEICVQEMIPLAKCCTGLGFGDLVGFSDFLPTDVSLLPIWFNVIQCFLYPPGQETAIKYILGIHMPPHRTSTTGSQPKVAYSLSITSNPTPCGKQLKHSSL